MTTKGSWVSSFFCLIRPPNFCSRAVMISSGFIVISGVLSFEFGRRACTPPSNTVYGSIDADLPLRRRRHFLGHLVKRVGLLQRLGRIRVAQLRRQQDVAGAGGNRDVDRL